MSESVRMLRADVTLEETIIHGKPRVGDILTLVRKGGPRSGHVMAHAVVRSVGPDGVKFEVVQSSPENS